MPYLSTVSTKSKQLQEILEVQNTAIRHDMKMEEDIADLKELLQL